MLIHVNTNCVCVFFLIVFVKFKILMICIDIVSPPMDDIRILLSVMCMKYINTTRHIFQSIKQSLCIQLFTLSPLSYIHKHFDEAIALCIMIQQVA